jgi:hypothetical protein
MHLYNAELLRLRAHTHTDPDARRADIGAALELARRQGATLFELRAALDDYELRGAHARAALVDAASRIRAESALPELTRARPILAQAAMASISISGSPSVNLRENSRGVSQYVHARRPVPDQDR